MSFYENLFHDTPFHKHNAETSSMFGINLHMLDVFELIHKHQRHFQQLCRVTVSGSISQEYNHYHIEIFEHQLPQLPFMRVSYRTCNIDERVSVLNVVTLMDSYSLGVIASIVKFDYLNRFIFKVNQWYGVKRGLLTKLESSIYY